MALNVTVITLGVRDLKKSVNFYRDGLGLRTDGVVGTEFENGAVAFFDLQNGMKLAVWLRQSIAKEANVPLTAPSPAEFTLGYNVNRKEEVDRIMELAKQAGAAIPDPPHSTFWGGYAGHFQDPDGHLWEIVWNPEWKTSE